MGSTNRLGLLWATEGSRRALQSSICRIIRARCSSPCALFSKSGRAPVYHWLNSANLSKDDIRWAQVRLYVIGFYGGSLDGVVGPETKRAILEFQKSNSLERTGRLDQQTADALTGDTVVGQGSPWSTATAAR